MAEEQNSAKNNLKQKILSLFRDVHDVKAYPSTNFLMKYNTYAMVG